MVRALAELSLKDGVGPRPCVSHRRLLQPIVERAQSAIALERE